MMDPTMNMPPHQLPPPGHGVPVGVPLDGPIPRNPPQSTRRMSMVGPSAGHNQPIEVINDKFKNLRLENEMDGRRDSFDDAILPDVNGKPTYEGWTLYKANRPGETPWTKVTRSRMRIPQDELAKLARKKMKKTLAEQYSAMSRPRRQQIDKLIDDKKRQDKDPRFDWISSMNIVLERHLRPGASLSPRVIQARRRPSEVVDLSSHSNFEDRHKRRHSLALDTRASAHSPSGPLTPDSDMSPDGLQREHPQMPPHTPRINQRPAFPPGPPPQDKFPPQHAGGPPQGVVPPQRMGPPDPPPFPGPPQHPPPQHAPQRPPSQHPPQHPPHGPPHCPPQNPPQCPPQGPPQHPPQRPPQGPPPQHQPQRPPQGPPPQHAPHPPPGLPNLPQSPPHGPHLSQQLPQPPRAPQSLSPQHPSQQPQRVPPQNHGPPPFNNLRGQGPPQPQKMSMKSPMVINNGKVPSPNGPMYEYSDQESSDNDSMRFDDEEDSSATEDLFSPDITDFKRGRVSRSHSLARRQHSRSFTRSDGRRAYPRAMVPRKHRDGPAYPSGDPGYLPEDAKYSREIFDVIPARTMHRPRLARSTSLRPHLNPYYDDDSDDAQSPRFLSATNGPRGSSRYPVIEAPTVDDIFARERDMERARRIAEYVREKRTRQKAAELRELEEIDLLYRQKRRADRQRRGGLEGARERSGRYWDYDHLDGDPILEGERRPRLDVRYSTYH